MKIPTSCWQGKEILRFSVVVCILCLCTHFLQYAFGYAAPAYKFQSEKQIVVCVYALLADVVFLCMAFNICYCNYLSPLCGGIKNELEGFVIGVENIYTGI
ncbi:hypothetical protein SORBI_3001G273650 [Sorghum bicolor]|uniref:Uncharacterized protein n=1 Tax=Sorghum bicolor TaxID=4558 RepID=A0A1Z5S7V4_SORBI|nr:hypothetical protein SORBI_3001G273650 [Sorghum bicolor]